jgi:glucan 1,3-beta-glucosidase
MQLPSVTDILASAQKFPGTPNGAWDAFAPVSKTYGADKWVSWVSSETIAPARFKRSVSPDQPTTSFVNRVLYEGMDMTPTQRCIAKGYSDGFLTAKIFASYNTSKLGFIGQYIEDSIRTLGPTVVASGTEGSYRQWFMSGLDDGEAIIAARLKPS